MHALWLTCETLGVPLRPPASAADLTALENRWGEPLPQTVLALLAEHDGLDCDLLRTHPTPAFLPIRPLSTRGILQALDQMEEVLESGEVHELFGLGLPLLEVDQGNFLVVFRDRALGERLALWPMLSEGVELWSLNLDRFALAWRSIQLQPEALSFDLKLDYPALVGALADDAQVAQTCLERSEVEKQSGHPARSLFWFDLAVQLWTQGRAAEMLDWPQVTGPQPEVGLSPRERVQESLQKRGLQHVPE